MFFIFISVDGKVEQIRDNFYYLIKKIKVPALILILNLLKLTTRFTTFVLLNDKVKQLKFILDASLLILASYNYKVSIIIAPQIFNFKCLFKRKKAYQAD